MRIALFRDLPGTVTGNDTNLRAPVRTARTPLLY